MLSEILICKFCADSSQNHNHAGPAASRSRYAVDCMEQPEDTSISERMATMIALLLVSSQVALARHEVFVDPRADDTALREHSGASAITTVRTVHEAAAHVRLLLGNKPGIDITVQLLPGVHHVGDAPLILGPEDGGTDGGTVTWRSLDGPSKPAIVGAPQRVTGWKPHPSVKGALSAPLPKSISEGSALRQLWVNGLRAERPKIYGHGRQPGDNRNGFCLNLTNVTRTEMYPEGSQFDFSSENATDPSKWKNPGDVEFVYTSCDAINCWIEPRCTVEKVEGSKVSLKQSTGNSSCYHRLYYYSQCFNNGKGPGRQGKRGQNPTHLENVESNFSFPGQFYCEYILQHAYLAKLLTIAVLQMIEQELALATFLVLARLCLTLRPLPQQLHNRSY